MDLGIAGRTVLCTGGSRGIGRVVAENLAMEGCRVAIVARNAADIDSAVKELRAAGGDAIGVTADVADPGQVRRAVEEVRQAFGPPDIVIGQTRYPVPGLFKDVPDFRLYEESFRSFTMSHAYLLHEVLPDMVKRGWGRYVHISTLAAKEPRGEVRHFLANAIRPATVGMLKTIADEYAEHGITFNTVAPGFIATDMTVNYLREHNGITSAEDLDAWAATAVKVPAKRFGRPQEVASLVTYLCSEGAGYINGTFIEVDGALHRSIF